MIRIQYTATITADTPEELAWADNRARTCCPGEDDPAVDAIYTTVDSVKIVYVEQIMEQT